MTQPTTAEKESGARCALVTIFNHKFERNIERLDALHAARFPIRRYVVPFATSARADVIGVYANGWNFGSHIAQAASRIAEAKADYYAFAADDLMLDPAMDERSLPTALGLTPRRGYIKSLCLADRLRYAFTWSGHATFSLRLPGYDWQAELPAAEDAWRRMAALDLHPASPAPRGWRDVVWSITTFRHMRYLALLNLLMTGRRSPYPLLVGYADFVVVPASALSRFAHFCGALSAANIQAEIAVPTALALACDEVATELPPGQYFLDGTPRMPRLSSEDAAQRREYAARLPTPRGLEIWGRDIDRFEQRYGRQLDVLLERFPERTLYVHPVKLSRWA